jgi:formylglycine-generating enzyme
MDLLMNRNSAYPYLIAICWFFAAQSVHAVTIDTVPVGNPGNAGQIMPQGTFGAVNYDYRIATTEISNAQYVEFLNAKAKADPYELYSPPMTSQTWGGIMRSGSPGAYTYAVKPDAIGEGSGGSDFSYAQKPVVYVSWYDAIRFANWLHNGQGAGNTETGAYTILGGTPTPTNGPSITRNANAKWFLPTENEWYKAAYYDGASATYYENATASAIHPNNNLPSADTGNSANFVSSGDYTTSNFSYPYTDVGAYTQSASAYGTFDQAGNVYEWNETLFSAEERIRRGGVWSNSDIQSEHRSRRFATQHDEFIGFRIATVIPEPSSVVLILVAVLLAALSVRSICRR